jgi:hypothetical protein
MDPFSRLEISLIALRAYSRRIGELNIINGVFRAIHTCGFAVQGDQRVAWFVFVTWIPDGEPLPRVHEVGINETPCAPLTLAPDIKLGPEVTRNAAALRTQSKSDKQAASATQGSTTYVRG